MKLAIDKHCDAIVLAELRGTEDLGPTQVNKAIAYAREQRASYIEIYRGEQRVATYSATGDKVK